MKVTKVKLASFEINPDDCRKLVISMINPARIPMIMEDTNSFLKLTIITSSRFIVISGMILF